MAGYSQVFCDESPHYGDSGHSKIKNQRRDGDVLLLLFPQEIWNMISQNLKSLTDLENLSNASPLFRKMLFNKRTLILFPKVWEVMDEFYINLCNNEFQMLKKRVRNFYEKKVKGACTSCSRSRTLRNYSALLELRLVCKSWKNGIDSYYENHPIHFQMRQEKSSKLSNVELIDKHPEAFDNNNNELNCFLQHFRLSHGINTNPFIGRTANLTIQRLNMWEASEELVSQILRKYGNQLWYCKLNLPISSRLNVDKYLYFHEWLVLMPNLKVLEVVGLDIQESETVFMEQLLRIQMNQLSIPTLPNLKFFRATKTISLICDEIIRKSPKLSMLELIKTEFPQEMRDLEKFSMRYSSFAELPTLNLSQIDWNLRTLHLVLQNFTEWPRIFSFIENWSATLLDLMIRLAEPKDKANKTEIALGSRSFTLNLPHLKHLKVILGSYSSIDFMLDMKATLESLIICADFNTLGWQTNKEYLQVEKDQVVQFIGYGKRLFDSNIWTLFPRLNYVKYSQTFSEKSEKRWTRYLPANVDVWNDPKNLSWTYTREQWKRKNNKMHVQPITNDGRLVSLEAKVKELEETLKLKDAEIKRLQKQLEINQTH